jgi:hypothetical protein
LKGLWSDWNNKRFVFVLFYLDVKQLIVR